MTREAESAKVSAINEVILDNGAEVSIFRNEDLLDNIEEVKSTIIVGVNGNDTGIKIDQAGTFRDYGKVYLSGAASANILSFNQAKENREVAYDAASDTFICSSNADVHVFENRKGLYVARFASSPRVFTFKHKVDLKSRLVRDIQRKLGFVSDQSLMKAVIDGSIRNLPIDTIDIRQSRASDPAIPILKGKAQQFSTVAPFEVHLPLSTPIEQSLHADLMFIEKETYLISVSDPMDLTMVDFIGLVSDTAAKSAKSIKNFLFGQIANYHAKGFNVNCVYCDGEGAFRALVTDLNHMGINVIVATANEHQVPKLDRRIRSIKDSVRCIVHSLPYTLPSNYIKWAIFFSVSRFNLLRHSNAHQQNTLSPRELFTKVKADFNRDLRVSFGDYCQVKVAYPDNTLKERSTSCIALLPMGNKAGSVKFLSLTTLSLIIRDQFIVFENVPDIIIKFMNELSAKCGKLIRKDPVLAQGEPLNIPDEDEILEARTIEEPVIMQPLEARLGERLEESSINQLAQPINESSPVHQEPSQPATQIESVVSSNQIQEASEEKTTDLEPSGWSGRLRSDRHGYRRFVNHIKTHEALQRWGEEARDAILKELEQMHMMKVWKPIHRQPKMKTIPSFVFFKEKFDATGTFQLWKPLKRHQSKLKARIVAGGNQQYRGNTKTSSPTVSINSVFIIATIAAMKGWIVNTDDITGAFLNAEMVDTVYMKLDKDVSELMCFLDPTYFDYLDDKLEINVQLLRALYGCIQSGLLWYECLSGTIIEFGFKSCTCDKCIFTYDQEDGKLIIAIYVDDLFITGSNQSIVDKFNQHLKSKFRDITINTGLKHSYLGVLFDFSNPGEVRLSADGYVEQLIHENCITNIASSPANNNILKTTQQSSPLPQQQSSMLQSEVAKLLYLSMRTRPDILLAVNHLCTRVNTYDHSDIEKHRRILCYLNMTRNQRLVLRCNMVEGHIPVYVYADASFALHPDGKSHSGVVISLGEGAILSKSSKQKIVTTSSTEAELVCASDSIAITYAVRNLIIELGYNVQVTMYQDNTSTIALIKNGQSNSMRTKHINVKYFHIRELIEKGVYANRCDDSRYFDKAIAGKVIQEIETKIIKL